MHGGIIDDLNELFIEDETLFEDLLQGAVSEGKRDSPVESEILALVHVGHLQHYLLHRTQSDHDVLGTHLY